MNILAHRGLWKSPGEKNTADAICGAFSIGYGCEIDLRDHEKGLVISHDPADSACAPFSRILSEWDRHPDCMLALDIKACGLAEMLRPILETRSNYFCFGMPLPEMLDFRDAGLCFYTRQSEYEPEPLLYDEAAGVWLDYFHDDLAGVATIAQHIQNEKRVCVVSADLNGRCPAEQWRLLKGLPAAWLDQITLCTDRVEEAASFFKDGAPA